MKTTEFVQSCQRTDELVDRIMKAIRSAARLQQSEAVCQLNGEEASVITRAIRRVGALGYQISQPWNDKLFIEWYG